MTLPRKPIIDAALLRGPRPLVGPITPGEVFAWEPDLPHARELLIVRRLYEIDGEGWVEAWDMEYQGTHHNEEARFREACQRTMFNAFPAERPPLLAVAQAAGKRDRNTATSTVPADQRKFG